SEFLEGKDEYIYYGVLSLIPVSISLYLSNFSDYIFLPLIFSGITAIYKVKREFEEKEWYFKKIKSQMDKLYKENLRLQEEILENQLSLVLLPIMQSIIKEEITFKEGLFELNEYFGAKGISFIDFVNHKCIIVGDAECKKETLAFIKDEIQVLTSKEIVDILKCKKAYSIVISNKDDLIYGILFILFDENINISDRLLRLIKDYLDFYFSKHVQIQIEEEKCEEEKQDEE
ncbi:MAG: hypothetical protein GXO21_01380, partial [Aquificae bacterium]|nr:hypothetical protein [Aquificota bacterium]